MRANSETALVSTGGVYNAPALRSGAERSSQLNQAAVVEARERVAAISNAAVVVQTGTYNVFAARRAFADKMKTLGNVRTIKELSEQITMLLNVQNALSLEETTEMNLISKAAWLYVRFNAFPLTVEPQAIKKFLDEKANRVVEFDLDMFVALPKDDNEVTWEKLAAHHHEAMNHLYNRLVAAVNESCTNLARGDGFGSFSDDEAVAWFATRDDEFVVVLEKIRLRCAQGLPSPHLHVGFNRFQQICQLAKQTYTSAATFMSIAMGEMRHDESLRMVADKKTSNKYAELAAFFRGGGVITGISFDYAFDGDEFKKHHPFSELRCVDPFGDENALPPPRESDAHAAMASDGGSGGIVNLYLDVQLARVSYDYLDGGKSGCCGCCGEPPRMLRNQKINAIKAIQNVHGLFEALSSSGPKRVLRRLSLMGYHLTQQDCTSLRCLLEGSALQHLNISGVSVSHEGCWEILAACVKNCTCLVTIEFSYLGASDAVHAALFEGLESSRNTLIEVICDGAEGQRGRASDLCTVPVSNVLSFPNMVSLSMNHQALPTDLIAYASKKLLSNPCMVTMRFSNNQHTSANKVSTKGCCCCQRYFSCIPMCMRCACCCDEDVVKLVNDIPSPAVMHEIETLLGKNKRNVTHRRVVQVVQEMLQRFRHVFRSAETAKTQLTQALLAQAEDAIRHQENVAHMTRLELAQAGAGRTNIAVNAVNATRSGDTEKTSD